MADLTVSWRRVFFFVVPNLFICTDATNYDTVIVLCSCGIPQKKFSMIPDYVRNLHHLSQLPDCLAQVDLDMPLVMSRMSLVMIPGI